MEAIAACVLLVLAYSCERGQQWINISGESGAAHDLRRKREIEKMSFRNEPRCWLRATRRSFWGSDTMCWTTLGRELIIRLRADTDDWL